MAEVAEIGAHDAAVLGSATSCGAWLGPTTAFVRAQADGLRRRPVALFSLLMQNQGDAPEARAARVACTAPASAFVPPLEEAFFAGRVDPTRLSLLERLAVRFVGSPP